MKYTNLIKKAMDICYAAHLNQKDKGDSPYVFHPMHLAEQMPPDEFYIATALLHDVVEDTSMTLESLRDYKIPEIVITAVDAISKRHDEPYDDYLERVAYNDIARRVKIEDIRHNMQIDRLTDKESETTKKRIHKYKNALKYLLYIDCQVRFDYFEVEE